LAKIDRSKYRNWIGSFTEPLIYTYVQCMWFNWE